MWRIKAYGDRIRNNGVFRSGGRKRLLLQWHVTERCNNRCSHCYQEPVRTDDLAYEALIGIVDQFCDLIAGMGGLPGHINVTGGEPFLRPDFMNILEALSSRKDVFSFAVLANGSLIDGKTAKRLKSLGPRFVQVSIDGDEATHDGIRGDGDYRRVVSAVRHLRDNGIETFVSFTAFRFNRRMFGHVARLGIKLGVSKVWTDRFIPWGGGAAMAQQVLSPAETREFLTDVAETRRRTLRNPFRCTEIASGRALQFLAGGGEPYRCAAGDTLVTVMADGDLVPCRRMPVPVGNVFDRPMERIYRESPFLNALRDAPRAGKGCEGCFYRHLCGGGLRCLSYALTGDPFSRDPGCWLEGRPDSVTPYKPESGALYGQQEREP